ncbi:MAG: GAF domain-containing protein [Desulfovibrionaceae bacterium]
MQTKTQEYYARMVSTIRAVFDAHSVVLYNTPLYNTSYGEQEYTILEAISEEGSIDCYSSFTAKDPLLGLLLRQENALVINNYDFRKKRQTLPYYIEGQGETIKSFVAVRLNNQGILCIDSERQYNFAKEELKILDLFTDLLNSIELQNSFETQSQILSHYCITLHLVCELRRKILKWSVFLREFLQLLVTATEYKHAVFVVKDISNTKYFVEGESKGLFLFEGASQEYPINSGAISWVFKNNSPLISEGTDTSPPPPLFGKNFDQGVFSSFLCLPVEMNKEVRGAICLIDDKSVLVSEELRGFVGMMAEYLGLYLESMEARTQLRNELNHHC